MIRNYIKIAIRNLMRNKTFSFINIFGLGLSMAVCLLVIIRVKDQLSYDKFHPQPDRMYRIITDVTNKEGNDFTLASTPLPLVDKLTTDFDVVESYVRIYPWDGNAQSGVKDLAVHPAFADGDFFKLFGYTLQSGNSHTALTSPNSIVLSKQLAEKFFGQSDAMGQVISLANLGDFRVTGVLNQPAGKSHLERDAYMSMSTVAQLEKAGKLTANLEQWNNLTSAYTYLLLKPQADQHQLTRAVHNISDQLMKQSKLSGKEHFSFTVQPFNKIILSEEMHFSLGNTGSRGKVLAEIVIAFVILLSACFNYTNLSVARSLKRGKEVGVRKVAGAVRSQVFVQFIIESLITAIPALVLGWLILNLIVGQDFSQEMASASDLTPDGSTLLWFTVFTLFAGLLAGVLPAWALSSFNPVEVLKNLSTVKLFLGNNFRKGLIVVQFTLSLVATIFTLTFFRQFDYMANADPGFRKDHIITIPVNANGQGVLKHELEQLSGVTGVAAISTIPGKDATGGTRVRSKPGAEPIGMDYYFADAAILSTMNLPLLAGTTFPQQADSIRAEQYVILNERALQPLHIGSPQEAVGKTIWIDDSVQVQVAGVLQNFFHRGMTNPYIPLVLRNKPGTYNYLIVSTSTSLPATFLTTVESAWKKQYPAQPFEGRWMNDEWTARNSATGTVGMLGFLTFITVTISVLGLLGMVIYTTETRRKEIGIRKVMGATVATIMTLLSKSFLKLLLIAGCIALPVGYLLGFFFLNIFANRISIGIDILLISFSGMLLIALMTIITQIYQVATANPVNSLRSE
ncbi:MAG: ABC transporter permease [Niastella sp.]|nr:ABC transporter permease [Niastella sp.]